MLTAELWRRLDASASQYEVSWHGLRGTGHPENEIADQLANRGIDELIATESEGYRAAVAAGRIDRQGKRSNVLNMRQIVLDTETTGLDPKQGHRIIEIGCRDRQPRLSGRNFHCYPNPIAKLMMQL